MHKAAIEVKDEAAERAAELFEAAEADVELDTDAGPWHIARRPGQVADLGAGGRGGRTRG